MSAEHYKESWEQMEALLGEADGDRLCAFLGTLPPGETARAVSHLSREAQEQHDAARAVEIGDARARQTQHDLRRQTVGELRGDERARPRPA